MLQKVSTFFPRIVIKNFHLFFVLQELLDDASDPLSTWLDTKVQHFNIAFIQIQTGENGEKQGCSVWSCIRT